jgi:dihydrofolate reductase
MRARACAYLAASVDGFIAREDGALDWLDPFQRPDEDYGYAGFLGTVQALVLGRRTWEQVDGFAAWPYGERRVVVLTHRPLPARHGETAYAGALAPLLETLAAWGVKRAYVDGGAAVRQALAERVLDELTVSWLPVTIGRGRPLFGPEVPPASWRLHASRAFDSGVVQVTWHRAEG